MTLSTYAHKLLPVLVTSCLIAACQGDVEPPPVMKPGASHQSTEEKHVVIPPEVARTWKSVKIAVIDKSRATENIYTVPIGGSSRIPASNLTVAAEVFLPSFFMVGSSITSSSNELKNPAVKVNISDNGSLVYKGWLFSNFPNTQAFMHPKFAFTLVDVVPASK